MHARPHFSKTTTAIKTLKRAISGSELGVLTELYLVIRGEVKSAQTKGAEIPAAARRPELHHRPRIAQRGSQRPRRTLAGLPESEPESSLKRRQQQLRPSSTQMPAGQPCPGSRGAGSAECGHSWPSRGTLVLYPHPVPSGFWLTLRVKVPSNPRQRGAG